MPKKIEPHREVARRLSKHRETNPHKHVDLDLTVVYKPNGKSIQEEDFLMLFDVPTTIPEVSRKIGVHRSVIFRRTQRAVKAGKLMIVGRRVYQEGRPPLLYVRAAKGR